MQQSQLQWIIIKSSFIVSVLTALSFPQLILPSMKHKSEVCFALQMLVLHGLCSKETELKHMCAAGE